MRGDLVIIPALLLLTGCAVNGKAGDGASTNRSSSASTESAEMNNSEDGSGSTSPGSSNNDEKKVIQPSPWQPPAEVDPVPPPVEGGETKEPGNTPG